jgi:hypothetical protein
VLIVEYVDREGTFVSAPEIGQQNKEFPKVNANSATSPSTLL